ncbi:MAG TPA: YceG family protein [Pseudobacteroides sp.]|uniref:YceG family protein n=1 Tax=Pseudobacteroides sp. TaxID=1968840 RepID=UPI002F93E3FD
MINISKPIKTTLLYSDKIMDDITTPLANRKGFSKGASTVIPVYCYRSIGVSDPNEDYYKKLADLDNKLSGLGHMYLRFTENIPILIENDISIEINKLWQDSFLHITATENLISVCNIPALLPDISIGPLGNALQNGLIDIINLYKKNSPSVTSTILKNLYIKLICWLKKFACPTFRNIDFQKTEYNPKIIYYGNIKEHEVYFILLLSKLGADVLYINTLTDGKFGEVDNGNAHSALIKLARTEELKSFPAKVMQSNNIPPASINNIGFSPSIPIPAQSSVPITAPPITRRDPSGSGKREMSLEELAALSSSTVMIIAFNDKGEFIRRGSGVVIGSNGLIATNYHVLQNACFFGVLFEGMSEENLYETYTVINANVHKDTALIKINFRTQPIEISKTGDLVRGQRVVAIGSPFGLMNTFSDGIVSGFRKYDRFEFIQITTPTSAGSSGGALLNMFGELVGLTTAGFDEGQNLNLAVPSKYIIDLLENNFTAFNLEVMDNYNTFRFDRIAIQFDGFFSYLSNERDYKVALLQSRYDQTNLLYYERDKFFIEAVEKYYIENIKNTAMKYRIEKYEFELMAGKIFFTYTYDRGRIVNKNWKYT